MKRRLTALFAVLLVGLLAGCSRVPQAKLDEVDSKLQQVRTMYQQADSLLQEAEAGNNDLPASLRDSFDQMDTGLQALEEASGEMGKMTDAQVDQLLAELDSAITALEDLVPKMETIRDMYADGGLAEKTRQISDKSKKLNEKQMELVEKINAAEEGGTPVPESVVEEIQRINAEVMAFRDELDEIYASTEAEDYDDAIEKLDGFHRDLDWLIDTVGQDS